MSHLLEQIQTSNSVYVAAFGEKGELAMPPKRRFSVLTCMDARLDPAKFAGLAEGDAHVIRNAGGRVSDDAIRSLVISYKLLGTREWLVVHHTNCGMETFDDGVIRELLSDSLTAATFGDKGWKNTGNGGGSTEGEFIDWLTIRDQRESIVADVRRLRRHPLVPREILIYGYLYDVGTGKLIEITEATKEGETA